VDKQQFGSSELARGGASSNGEGDTVKHLSVEMGSLIEELRRAQQEFELAAGGGAIESQGPVFAVLKSELLNQMKATAEHMRQLRWLLKELLAKDSETRLAQTLKASRERGGASFVEHVDAIITAALGEKHLLRS
jgi:hypothetical protein